MRPTSAAYETTGRPDMAAESCKGRSSLDVNEVAFGVGFSTDADRRATGRRRCGMFDATCEGRLACDWTRIR